MKTENRKHNWKLKAKMYELAYILLPYSQPAFLPLGYRGERSHAQHTLQITRLGPWAHTLKRRY